MDKHFYINKFQPFLRHDINTLEKNNLINRVLNNHMKFFVSLIRNNDNIEDNIKGEMFFDLDCIFFTLYHFLMNDIYDIEDIVSYLFTEEYAVNFKNRVNEFNLLNVFNITIVINDNINN
jgi:hypothetical protein